MHKFVKHQKTKGNRKNGFLGKKSTHNGKKILKRRRDKKRGRLTL